MRSRVRLLLRLVAIQRVLVRHGLDDLVWRTHLYRPLAWLGRLFASKRRREAPLGERIREALEALGPIFVKFGQAVSVRRDLLPARIADELEKLQDQVPPFASELAVEMIGQALGAPVSEVYAEFDEAPLAAASVAQVHTAKLASGEQVVVKILRPQVRELIRRDIEVLQALAELAERYWPDGRRLRPREVVAEFERTLENELNLLREAANASALKRNFEGSELLYVPEVHWDYTRKNVLTMERIEGVPIGDVDALRDAGTDIRRLAENGVEIFFTQVFRHNFFHADMHPGNIFVDVTDPARPRYVAVDFGIVGSLTERDQLYLAENFLAFFRRDYTRVARLHIDSGWVPPDTRVDDFASAIRSVCEPIFNKPLKDISFGIVLLRLFETARMYHMQVQPQLVLLQKTLLAIEGLGRQIYPELDLWKTAYPILEEWMRERRDPRAHIKRLISAWPEISEDLQLLPELLHRTIRQAEARRGERPARREAWMRRRREAMRANRRLAIAGILLIAGVLWTGLGAGPAWIGWAAAAGALIYLLAAMRRL